jgi:hypothetical protein
VLSLVYLNHVQYCHTILLVHSSSVSNYLSPRTKFLQFRVGSQLNASGKLTYFYTGMKRYTASTEQIAQVTVRLHTVKCIVNVFKRIPGTSKIIILNELQNI